MKHHKRYTFHSFSEEKVRCVTVWASEISQARQRAIYELDCRYRQVGREVPVTYDLVWIKSGIPNKRRS